MYVETPVLALLRALGPSLPPADMFPFLSAEDFVVRRYKTRDEMGCLQTRPDQVSESRLYVWRHGPGWEEVHVPDTPNKVMDVLATSEGGIDVVVLVQRQRSTIFIYSWHRPP